MNNYYDPKESERVAQTRESFSGRPLINRQYDDGMAYTGIVERGIHHDGKFRDRLSNLADSWARTEKFDAMRAETILRDLFKARTGQSMNQRREELLDNEANLPDEARERAQEMVRQTGEAVKHGNKMSFYRAYDHHAGELAREFKITNVGARRVMNEVFREERDTELYDWGKELEEKYYRPQIEAERQERQSRSQSKPGSSRSRTRQPA